MVDLYSGCGGLSLGFKDAGFDFQLAFDSWLPAITNYKQLVGDHIVQQDLSDEHSTIAAITKLRKTPNLIIGGPPCQDFSSAGKRTEGKNADQTIKFVEVVRAVQPDVFVMENVTLAKKSGAWKHAVSLARDAAYFVEAFDFNAARFDVPQRRHRLFTIGTKTPEVIELFKDRILEIESPHEKTVREERILSIETEGLEFYYRHPRSYERRGVFSIDEPSPTIRGVNRPVPPTYNKHPKNANELAGVDISEVRSLTHEERAQIQTFPRDYVWKGTNTEIEQMIGNAVPVRLARAIAEAINFALENC